MGSKSQNSAFSEHGHDVHQIKGNHDCSNMEADIFPAEPPFASDPRRWGQNVKIRVRAKIRNQYNQAPHLTQDTNGKVTTP